MRKKLRNYVGEHVYKYAITLEKKKKSLNDLIDENSSHGTCQKCNKCNMTSIHGGKNYEEDNHDECGFCTHDYNVQFPSVSDNIEEYATTIILKHLRQNDIQKQMHAYRANYQELNYCSICFEFYWRDKENYKFIEFLIEEGWPRDIIDYDRIFSDDYVIPLSSATCFVCERYYCYSCDSNKYGEKRKIDDSDCSCNENDCIFCENAFCCFTCVNKISK